MMGGAWSSIRRWFGWREEEETEEVTAFVPYPRPKGSIIHMQKQDPSVTSVGYRPVWTPTRISPGPKSYDIKVKIGKTVYPSDTKNNYLYDREDNFTEYSAVSVFGMVDHVLTMYRRGLKRMGSKVKLGWNWGSSPIQVHPRAGEMANAVYSRNERSLLFYYFDDRNGRRIYTCESFDIVAHETGHAVLDDLKPHYIESNQAQCGALHESFGDITAILAMLEQLDMCEAVIAHSKCNLHSPTFFMRMAEQMGEALGLRMGLRNADNNLRIDQVTEEIHDLSRVFTGAFFDTLVEIFETLVNLDECDPAETLYKVGKYMSAIAIVGFLNGPKRDAEFRDIANAMINAAPEASYKAIFKKHFEKRRIFDRTARPRPHNLRASMQEEDHPICGTQYLVHDQAFREKVVATFQFLNLNDDNNDMDDETACIEELKETLGLEETALLEEKKEN